MKQDRCLVCKTGHAHYGVTLYRCDEQGCDHADAVRWTEETRGERLKPVTMKFCSMEHMVSTMSSMMDLSGKLNLKLLLQGTKEAQPS